MLPLPPACKAGALLIELQPHKCVTFLGRGALTRHRREPSRSSDTGCVKSIHWVVRETTSVPGVGVEPTKLRWF